MIDQAQERQDWQQYYPTYNFGERDILLKEYEAASNNVLSQEKLFTNAAQLLIVAATLVGSSFAVYAQSKPNVSDFLTPQTVILGLVLLMSVTWLTLRYFADRQKSIIFDSRKIVVLRRMLGLDYGTQQMVLPNWRIEGASNPFAIRLFQGWLSYAAYPFWILLLSSVTGLLYLFPYLVAQVKSHALVDPTWFFGVELQVSEITWLFVAIWIVVLVVTFRQALFDTNETWILATTFLVARIFRVALVGSFEYTIYRARLAYFEMRRIRVQIDSFIPILIHFEDRTYYRNRGVSIRGILRAIRDYVKRRRISGGSTLTQQLVRSLFIIDYHKTLRRKLLEIPLAFWATSRFSKEEILELYAASVRFDKGVYGIPAALDHFFGVSPSESISKARSFFLAERISNVRSMILVDRLRVLAASAVSAGLLDSSDLVELRQIYRSQVDSNLLRPTDPAGFQLWLSGK